jgi:hypothetical protein
VKRALLIGCAVDGLRGVDRDLELIEAALARHGFKSARCAGEQATRANILDAFAMLVDATESDDAIVVYYSGHGGESTGSEGEHANDHGELLSSNERSFYRYLVPIDIAGASDDDFRGLLNIELSLFLLELTDKTHNVTLILDCCHSGAMTRGPDDERKRPLVRSLRRCWSRGAAALVEKLRCERGAEMQRRHPECNPHVVRVVACSPRSRAYTRYFSQAGLGWAGAMTVALCEVLNALEPAGGSSLPLPSWAAVGRQITARVAEHPDDQVPVIEGPTQRRLFSVQEQHQFGALRVTFVGDEPTLVGGHALGVCEGDEYAIVPAVTRDEQPVAHVRVSSCRSDRASVMLIHGRAEFTAGDTALPLCHGRARGLVRIIGDDTGLIAETLGTAGMLGVTDQRSRAIAQVELTDGWIHTTACEDALYRYRAPLPFGPTSFPVQTQQVLAYLRASLEMLARCQALRSLTPHLGSGLAYEFGWSRVEDGRLVELDTTGAELNAGQRFTVAIHNTDTRALFASILSILPDGEIRLLSQSEPSGVELAAQDRYLLGHRSGALATRGELIDDLRLLEAGTRVPAALVLFVSDRQIDMRAWETGRARPFGVHGLGHDEARSRESDLDDTHPELHEHPARFDVQVIEFFVKPNGGADPASSLLG